MIVRTRCICGARTEQEITGPLSPGALDFLESRYVQPWCPLCYTRGNPLQTAIMELLNPAPKPATGAELPGQLVLFPERE